ncbi:hypothetical protein, partial [Sphingorhabdus sp.]|uniref:hypothetical protein n=1 Tax=Sphingorhabdus sp. TaxID=1902408 RepID=UPI004053A46B
WLENGCGKFTFRRYRKMSTILSEEPDITDRESVILSNAERRYLRRKFNDSLAVTREILNPRNQLARFVERKTTQAKQVAGETIQIAKHNAPVIGIVGMGALLFAARRPISRWISSLRKSKIKTPSSD